MTFSQKVKAELLAKKRSTDASVCMLAGIILSSGSLVLSNKLWTFSITSENEEFLKTVKTHLQSCFQIAPNNIHITSIENNLKGKFELSVDAEDGYKVLKELSILNINRDGDVIINRDVDLKLLDDIECSKAYLAGAFCGAGSVSVPQGLQISGGYHLEWVSQTEERAATITNLLASLEIISKKIERNGSFVVYLKESDSICSSLAQMGAVASMLDLESNKVERQVRNNINRQSNCLSANLDKVCLASVKQIKAIETIKEILGLENLPEGLCNVALARLANPEASLSELATLLGGNISRVAVSLRLNKIIKIASDLGENNE